MIPHPATRLQSKCSREPVPQRSGLSNSLLLGFSKAMLKNLPDSYFGGMALRMVFFVTSSVFSADDSSDDITVSVSLLLSLRSTNSLWVLRKTMRHLQSWLLLREMGLSHSSRCLTELSHGSRRSPLFSSMLTLPLNPN